ncbi:hypothetical protein F5148DRAFT_111013 [Russula earlei]|uniref:Uncharacterized protein n=1 Tax=Russula earlei TaxID=71964 RepID=A0ACC0U8Q8_9AGAM|nr:hypothetical protein F5148DRAFT_111013 [Russula earlei]
MAHTFCGLPLSFFFFFLSGSCLCRDARGRRIYMIGRASSSPRSSRSSPPRGNLAAVITNCNGGEGKGKFLRTTLSKSKNSN